MRLFPSLLAQLLGCGAGRIAKTEQQNFIFHSKAARPVGSSKAQPLICELGRAAKYEFQKQKAQLFLDPGLACVSLPLHPRQNGREQGCPILLLRTPQAAASLGLEGEGSSLRRAATAEVLCFSCLYSCQIHLVRNSFCSQGYTKGFYE